MYLLSPSALLSVLLGISIGQPYTVYDTNYEYEVGDTQTREEILITETPEILSLPQHLVVSRGQTVRLPCMVDRLEGFVLLWRKDDNIISVGSQVLDSSGGISVEESVNSATLVLSGVAGDISGEYVCSVSTYIKTEVRHTVTTMVEPVITTQGEVRVREGENARLACQLQEGSPIPTLRWRKCEGETYLDGTKDMVETVLILSSVSRQDSGCYVCVAGGEDPVTSKTMLVVEHSLDITDSEHKEVKNVIKPSKLEKNVYFARVPSLYTIPEKQNKPEKQTISFQQQPKNAEEFLQLLRIYRQKTFPQERTENDSNDETPHPEDTTESKLLRSTHSYLKHLEEQLIMKNNSQFGKKEKPLQPGAEERKGQVDNNFRSILINSNSTFEENREEIKEEKDFLGKEENQSKEQIIGEEAVDEEKERHFDRIDDLRLEPGKPKLEKTYSQQTMPEKTDKVTGSRYLKEVQLQEETKGIKDDVQKTKSKVLRGQHALFSNLAETNNKQHSSVSIDSHQEDFHIAESKNTDETNVLNKSEISITNKRTDKAYSQQTTSEKNDMVTGSRYLKEAQLREEANIINRDVQKPKSKVLRGHHALFSSLAEANNKQHSSVVIDSHQEDLNMAESKDIDEINVLGKSEKNIKDKRTDKATETPKELEINNYPQNISTGSRYLNEDQLKENAHEIEDDKQETKSKVLRGHHSLHSNLLETNIPSLEYSDSVLEQSPSIKINTMSPSQNGHKNVQDKKFREVEEEFYPKEIQDMEKMYFKTLSQISQESKIIRNHPLVVEEKAKPEERNKIHSQEEKTSMPSHPLMTLPNQHPKVVNRLINEKTSTEVNGKPFINAERDKMVLIKSKPLREIYSNEKIIKDVPQETEEVQDKKRNKEKDKKRGPHPFAGLRFRIP